MGFEVSALAEKPVGIYLLANDHVVEWATAAMESIRKWASDYPVVIIPFAEDMRVVERLVERHGADIIRDPVLERLDALGKRFFPSNPVGEHLFRKFFVFFGPLQRFLYLDVDIVLTRPVGDWLPALLGNEADLIYTDSGPGAAYTPWLRDQLGGSIAGPEFSTGSFVSGRGVLSFRDLETVASEALELQDGFAPMGEQPFFNYCFDSLRRSTLSAARVIDNLPSSTWAGADVAFDREATPRDGQGIELPFVHWAGMRPTPSMPGWDLYWSYRTRGITGPRKLPVWARFAARDVRLRSRRIVHRTRER